MKKKREIQFNRRTGELISDICITVAAIMCMVFSAGFFWQYCIVPLTLMVIGMLLRSGRIDITYLSVAVILLGLMAFSLFTTQGDPRDAVYETEKLLIFVVALIIGKSVKKSRIMDIFSVVAILTAIMGLFAYCSGIKISDYVLDIGDLPRLQSFTQYANTTACILGCGYICCLDREPGRNPYLMRCGMQLILIAFYLTLSKACIPIFMAVCTLLMLKNRDKRCQIIFQNIIALALFLPIAICADHGYNVLAALLCIGCIASGGIELKWDRAMFAAWCVLIVAAGLFFAALIKLRPTTLDTFSERAVYMKDAIRASVHNLFGYGTGSWGVLQYKFQSAPYGSRFIHNGWLQFLFENGIIFFAVVVMIAVYGIYGLYKKNATAAAAAAILISVHSLIDFDLSFPLVTLLFGMLLSHGTEIVRIRGMTKKIRIPMLIILTAAVCFVNIHMINEFAVRNSFEHKYTDGKLDEAKKTALLLEKICPYDAKLQISLAALDQKQNREEAIVRKRIKKALKISPNDPDIYKDYMNHSMGYEDVSEMCRTLISMCPKQSRTLIFLGSYTSEAYEKKLITANERDAVLSYAQECMDN